MFSNSGTRQARLSRERTIGARRLPATSRARLRITWDGHWAIVRGARLLEFDEAVDLLSSLRLGVALGLVDNHSLQDVNEVLMASQRAHIQMRLAGDCDEFRISSERADLVRAKFA